MKNTTHTAKAPDAMSSGIEKENKHEQTPSIPSDCSAADSERALEEFDEAWSEVIGAALSAGLISSEELLAYYDAIDFELCDLQDNDRIYTSPDEIAGSVYILGPRTTALRFLFRALLFHDPCWKKELSDNCCCEEDT